MRLEIKPQARIEMRDAVIRHGTSYPSAMQDFESELESLIEHILEMPRLYQIVRQPDIRRALMRRRFPYSIYFREIENGVEIIALSHHSRRQDYWLDRI